VCALCKVDLKRGALLAILLSSPARRFERTLQLPANSPRNTLPPAALRQNSCLGWPGWMYTCAFGFHQEMLQQVQRSEGAARGPSPGFLGIKGVPWLRILAAFAVTATMMAGARAQVDPSLFSGLRWRLIGPFRGGRTVAVAGVPGQPKTHYFGAVAGGLWKTTDGGVTTGENLVVGRPCPGSRLATGCEAKRRGALKADAKYPVREAS
jgi:hypothetical protein